MTTRTAAPRAARREGRSTREAILAAATRLIAVRGYKATSLDDVLQASGVGKGNFYYHFKSKEDLGYAILDGVVAGFLERTLEPCFADTAGRPLEQLQCFLSRLLEAQRARQCVGGCVLGNLAAELSDVHAGFRARLATVFHTWRQRIMRVLEEARTRGEVSPACDPGPVAQFIVASLEGAILLSKVTKDIGVMEQCVAELDRYLAAFAAAPGGPR